MVLFALAITISSCKKTLPPITVSYSLADYQGCTTYSSTQYTDIFIDTITAAGIQQAFATSGVTYDLSKVNTSKQSALTVTALYGGTLDDVSTIQVYITSAGSSGLGPEIAHIENITAGASTAALNLNSAELKGYLGTNNVVTILVANKGYGKGNCLDFSQGVIVSQVAQ